MKSGWEVKKLGNVCDFEGGSQPPKSYFVYEEKLGYVRFLQIRDFSSDKNITYIPESKKNRLCKQDDILLGRYGASVGKVLTNKCGAYNVAIMKTLPNPEVLNIRYFFFYLSSNEFQSCLQNISARSAQNGFSKDDIYDFPIAIPPLPEQQRIVALLDEAFDAIAKAKEIAEKNLQNAREIFESYLQNVFANPGERWEEKKLGDLFAIKHGFAFKSEYFMESGEYILLTPGNFFERGGYRDRGEKQKYYVGVIPENYILKKGDLLVAMTEQAAGLLGSAVIVPESNKFLHNQRLGLIIYKNTEEIVTKFLFHMFNTRRIRSLIHESASGVKVRHTSPEKILTIRVFLPPYSEQQAIVTQLDVLSEETKKLEAIYTHKLADLEELKKSILQKAFNGEL